MVILYDRNEVQNNVNRMTIKEAGRVTPNDETIRLSENLSYVFRMFLFSMLFIVIVLAVST